MPEITEAQVRELLERCKRTPPCKSCMTEQGRNGILFTVFEKEPLCSERIGSFIHQDYAWFFIETRNLLPALAESWLQMAGEAERLRELECSVCPEDWGFVEYIKYLETKLTAFIDVTDFIAQGRNMHD